MREIKFRAWDKIDNTMAIVEEWHKTWIAIGVNDEDSGHLEQRKIEDVELMQYTGLKDKNGKEIYEDDVVYLAGYGNYQVVFPFMELYEAEAEKDIGEILGNIYKNPELLKD